MKDKENTETLVKFSDTYFWDVFAIICTGVMIFVEIDVVTKIEKTHFLSWNVLNWFTYLFIFYILGLIGDALLGFFPLKEFMKKFLTNEFEEQENIIKEKVIEKFKRIRNTQDFESINIPAKVRNYLEIHHISHRYLSFFSKQRLYQNLSILSLVNILIIWIIYFYPNPDIFEFYLYTSQALFLSFLSLMLAVGFWQLSNKFWFHACSEIYSKFLIFDEKGGEK